MTQLSEIRIVVLVDNVSPRETLTAEHGFACLVEADGHRVLFDTGAHGAIIANSVELGVKLAPLDAIVLSHGHYDHTGGLAAVVERVGRTRLVSHPGTYAPHRSQRTGTDRDIGLPQSSRLALERLELQLSRDPVEIVPGVHSTGEIPRRIASNHSVGLFSDPEGRVVDPLLDDLALVLRHEAGLVLLLGCTHAGIVDTLDQTYRLFPNVPLLAVIGGLHLDGAGAETIERASEALRARTPALVAPGHCTGADAKKRLESTFAARYETLHTGAVIRVTSDGRCAFEPVH